MRLSFLGAADTVTGSKTLLDTGTAQVLIDCGLFQGIKKLRERNWRHLPCDAGALAAVCLTHAHIDHSGYLPRLVAAGFRGPVYCTPGTRDLLRVLLPDAGHLQEEDAQHANRHGYARHHPAAPLYTREQAERCLDRLRPVDYDTDFAPAPGITARFTRAGHIIGAASLVLTVARPRQAPLRIGFSGDVGRQHDPVMLPPAPLPEVDCLVLESTYGDRRHPADDVAEALAEVVRDTVRRDGVLLVPAFAVGRAQHLLHLVASLRAEHRIPAVPLFLDSPMAASATGIFFRHRHEHRLTDAQCRAMDRGAMVTPTPEESRAIGARHGPAIVVSASGMCTGGRVLHHLRHYLPDPRNTVLIVGYQAPGTRGRSLLDGVDALKMFGEYVPVRARIEELRGLSAHADHEDLVRWLRGSNVHPRRVFVNHGEPAATDALRRRLVEAFGWQVHDPDDGSTWVLE